VSKILNIALSDDIAKVMERSPDINWVNICRKAILGQLRMISEDVKFNPMWETEEGEIIHRHLARFSSENIATEMGKSLDEVLKIIEKYEKGEIKV